MKTIYCVAEQPYNLIVELERPQQVTEQLFRQELQRLIDQAVSDKENPVQQAIDHLRMADHPTNPQNLLQAMMQEEAISSLMQQVEGKQLVEAPQEVKEEYQRRTLISFLTEVMPDQNH